MFVFMCVCVYAHAHIHIYVCMYSHTGDNQRCRDESKATIKDAEMKAQDIDFVIAPTSIYIYPH